MYIVQIASEIAPVAKVGGLADVMMGLSRELKWKGHRVDIILPKYDCLDFRYLHATVRQSAFQSYFQGQLHDNSMWSSRINGDLALTFIEPHHPKRFFERDTIYGCADDVDRFLYFARATLEYLKSQKQVPDIIHLHDWQTAIIALLIKDPYFKEHFARTKVVFTIHNFEYQGRCSPHNIDDIGLVSSSPLIKEILLDSSTGDFNLLKAGILASNHVVTVSPTYAKEVLTPEGGKGLESTLKQCQNKFCGILNGLDYSYWNPEIDRFIGHHYTKADIEPKRKNKAQLLAELSMSYDHEKPLIAAVARLVAQKGIDLLEHALSHSAKIGAQFLLLGTAPDPVIQEKFLELQKTYKDHPDIRIILKSEEALAHRIYAASDMLLVPSIFEPCGLTQLIALKYGSVPIVRRTGGLADTVFDVAESGLPFEKTNGFSFNKPDVNSLDVALDKAVQLYKQDKKRWHELVLQGMNCDFSWNKSADDYITIYKE